MQGIEADVVQAILDDWKTAPINNRLRAMLGYLEKLTVSPDELTKADIADLRANDLTDEAIFEATYVCAMFNIIDRLADSFDFEVPSVKGVAKSGRFLNKFGYKPAW